MAGRIHQETLQESFLTIFAKVCIEFYTPILNTFLLTYRFTIVTLQIVTPFLGVWGFTLTCTWGGKCNTLPPTVLPGQKGDWPSVEELI